MSMITATTWVRRGIAAPFPTKYEIDEDEINRISKLAQLQLQDAQQDLKAAQDEKGGDRMDEDEDEEGGVSTSTKKENKKADGKTQHGEDDDDDDDDLKEYDLEHYDSEAVDEDGEKATMFGNVRSLAYHQPHEKDPYITMPEGENKDQDEDEEREDLQIRPTDNLLLAAKVEDEVAHMEAYVYEDEVDNLYVHHDIMLPAIPLCVEWVDFPVGKNTENREHGNFVAVGTMEPDIEVWDLDIVDCMYPNAILGHSAEADDTKSTKKKKKRSKKVNDQYHIDAVLSLAANRSHRNLLASASADKTVKLWDLNTAKCAKSYAHHTDKVCSLDWHPREATVLLSGSYDKSVVAADMRTPEAQAGKWRVDADIETVRWDPHDSNVFYATTDSGRVYAHDARNASSSSSSSSSPLWTLQAHDSSVSSFDVNPLIPGFLVTGSTDKQVKLWNTADNKPSMVVSRNLEVGKVFSTSFAPDPEVGFRLAVAGSKGVVQVWDTSTNAAVRRAFAGKMGQQQKADDSAVQERLVGLVDDESSDSEDEQEGGEGEGEGEGEGGKGGGAPEGGKSDSDNEGWESMDED